MPYICLQSAQICPVCNKWTTQFYLPPTHEPYLPLLSSSKASPPFGWYSSCLPTNGWPGWVDLGDWLHNEINVPHWELNPDTVAHQTTVITMCVLYKGSWCKCRSFPNSAVYRPMRQVSRLPTDAPSITNNKQLAAAKTWVSRNLLSSRKLRYLGTSWLVRHSCFEKDVIQGTVWGTRKRENQK